MRPRRSRLAAAGLVLALVSGCDTGPDGPGTVVGTVTGGPDLGAVVLDVVWRGIQGFDGRGSTQVYSAPVPGEPDRYRIVLVGPTGGDLSFGIDVDDLYLEGPVVTVVEAVGDDDSSRTVADLRVILER